MKRYINTLAYVFNSRWQRMNCRNNACSHTRISMQKWLYHKDKKFAYSMWPSFLLTFARFLVYLFLSRRSPSCLWSVYSAFIMSYFSVILKKNTFVEFLSSQTFKSALSVVFLFFNNAFIIRWSLFRTLKWYNYFICKYTSWDWNCYHTYQKRKLD